MEWVTDPQIWIALLTLTALEVVLGIDNIIFITIIAQKLPPQKQGSARTLGLGIAMISRIALLFSLTWIMGLVHPLFQIFGIDISGRDIILIGGGLFLLGKSTFEIHDKLEGSSGDGVTQKARSFAGVLIQIALLDIVFSLDSVITAIGMTDRLGVMIAAIVIAVVLMMIFMKAVSDFVHRHPTVTMLALSFLLMIGVSLIVEGLHQHIPKGYIYFAMAFSVFVEMLNIRIRRRKEKPVQLRQPLLNAEANSNSYSS